MVKRLRDICEVDDMHVPLKMPYGHCAKWTRLLPLPADGGWGSNRSLMSAASRNVWLPTKNTQEAAEAPEMCISKLQLACGREGRKWIHSN